MLKGHNHVLNIFFSTMCPGLLAPIPVRGLAVSRSPDIHRLRWYLCMSPVSAVDLQRGEKRFLRVPSVCVSPSDPSLISSSDDEGGMLSSKRPKNMKAKSRAIHKQLAVFTGRV